MSVSGSGRSIITFEEGSLLTKGNNPWLDGITYNGKWGTSPLIPTVVDIKILQPKDQKLYQLDDLVWYQFRSNSGEWIQDGNPIGKVEKAYRRSIKNGYKAWSDVANLDFNFIKNPMESGVLVVFSKYANKGFRENGGQLLGSHRGLLIDKTIGQVDMQLGSQLGEISQLGSKPAASPVPLILDLNYDHFITLNPSGPEFMETIVHEVGHGIGMSHPHDRGLGSVPSGIFPGIQSGDSFAANGTGLYGLNQNVYTIMSYNGSSESDGAPDEIHSITPMALELLAAQIKYGPNLSTGLGDTVYNLKEATAPQNKAWSSIWDAGGTDSISAKGMKFGVNISLRPAEMNAQRPETGLPQEQYRWPSAWSQYRLALDFLVNAEASRPGFLLGSGIKKNHIFTTILNEINGLEFVYSDVKSDQLINDLEVLSDALKVFYGAYGFIGLFSMLDANNKLPDNVLPDNASGEIESAVEKFNQSSGKLEEFFNTMIDGKGFITFIQQSGFSSISVGDYYKDLSRVEQLQSDVQTRSAKGVAGYISEVHRSEVSSLPVADRPGGGFTIAAGVTIENAVGGKGNDVITGNASDNFIRGLGGDDLINPYLGSNKIKGGQGVDTVNFDSELGSWHFSDLSFEQGDRWLEVTMGDSGDINRLRGVEFLVFGGNQYPVEALV